MFASKLRHNIIVLGGHTSALFVTRSFGPFAPKIAVIDNRGYGEARFSRYCTEFHKVDRFSRGVLVKKISEIGQRLGPCAIFPSTDETVELLSHIREDLDDIHLPMIPEWSVTKLAFDKQETYALARQLDIPVPETFNPESLDDARHIASNCEFPVIIKPSTTVEFRALFRKKALWAENRDDMISIFKRINDNMPIHGISVQEYIPGPNTDFCNYLSCFHDGAPAFECTITRGRQYPIDFGTATHVNLARHDRLITLGRRLLSNMGFWGMASTQFKYCQERDKYYLLDLNARTWKCIGIIETLGINLPLIAYQLRIGESPDASFEPPAEPHVWVDILADIYVSLVTIAKGDLTVRDWLNSYKGKVIDCTFSAKDPLPGVILLLTAPWLVIRGMR
jgi:predicted ATP-grasp superfamily ATP-dependent carboligase